MQTVSKLVSQSTKYAEQLSSVARKRVIRHKSALMWDALLAARIKDSRFLDVGRGDAWYIGALEAQGARVTRVDLPRCSFPLRGRTLIRAPLLLRDRCSTFRLTTVHLMRSRR